MRRKIRQELYAVLRQTGQAELIMSYRQHVRMMALFKIKKFALKWVRKVKRRKLQRQSAILIQKVYRGRRARNTAFLRAIQLHKYPRIFFLKDQGRIVVQLLRKIRPMFKQFAFTSAQKMIQKGQKEFCMIRYREPRTVQNSNLPIISLVRPNLEAVVRVDDYLMKESEFNSKNIQSSKWRNMRVASFFNDYEQHKYWLDLFKPRNGHHRTAQILSALRKMKERDDGMSIDRYGDLCMFEPPQLVEKVESPISLDKFEENKRTHKIKPYEQVEEQDQDNNSQNLTLFKNKILSMKTPVLSHVTEVESMGNIKSPMNTEAFKTSTSKFNKKTQQLEGFQDLAQKQKQQKKVNQNFNQQTTNINSLRIQLLVTLFFAAFDYNRQHPDNPLLIFTESQLRRSAAATKIQSHFRSHLKRKKQASSFSICRYIITRRAILTIQHWWKALKLQRRLSALRSIKQHAQNINESTLYLQERIYNNLIQLSDLRKKGASFQEQSFVFGIANYQLSIRILCQHGRYDINSVPKWFHPINMPVLGSSFTGIDPQSSRAHQDIMALIHMNQADCQLLNFSSIIKVDVPSLMFIPKLKFIKIQCKSVDQAKRRAVAIALLTYSFRQRQFVKLFSPKMMQNPFFVTTIQALWRKLGYKEPQQREDLKMYQSQPHNGIVILGGDKNLQYLQSSNNSVNNTRVNTATDALGETSDHNASNIQSRVRNRIESDIVSATAAAIRIHQDNSVIQMSDNVSVSLFLKTPPGSARNQNSREGTSGVREVFISKKDGIKMRLLNSQGDQIIEEKSIQVKSEHQQFSSDYQTTMIPESENNFSSRERKVIKMENEQLRKSLDDQFKNQLVSDTNFTFSNKIDKIETIPKTQLLLTGRTHRIPVVLQGLSLSGFSSARKTGKKQQQQKNQATQQPSKSLWNQLILQQKRQNAVKSALLDKMRIKKIISDRNKEQIQTKRQQVIKQRLVREVMRQEQKNQKYEMQKTFRTLNKEEKQLTRSILQQYAKDDEYQAHDRKMVVEQKFQSKRLKDNQRMFAKCFAQQQNMIIKQYRLAQTKRIKNQILQQKRNTKVLSQTSKDNIRKPLKIQTKAPPSELNDNIKGLEEKSNRVHHFKALSLCGEQEFFQRKIKTQLVTPQQQQSSPFLPPIPLSARQNGGSAEPQSALSDMHGGHHMKNRYNTIQQQQQLQSASQIEMQKSRLHLNSGQTLSNFNRLSGQLGIVPKNDTKPSLFQKSIVEIGPYNSRASGVGGGGFISTSGTFDLSTPEDAAFFTRIHEKSSNAQAASSDYERKKEIYKRNIQNRSFLSSSDITPWKKESFKNVMGINGVISNQINVNVSFKEMGGGVRRQVGKPMRHSNRANIVFGKYVRNARELNQN